MQTLRVFLGHCCTAAVHGEEAFEKQSGRRDLNPRPLDPQILAPTREPQRMPRSVNVEQSAEVPRDAPGSALVAVRGCCTADPGHGPRARTQGTDPGHRPRARTQGTDPGHRPRARTQGTDPGGCITSPRSRARRSVDITPPPNRGAGAAAPAGPSRTHAEALSDVGGAGPGDELNCPRTASGESSNTSSWTSE
jgi:hypothetical protein